MDGDRVACDRNRVVRVVSRRIDPLLQVVMCSPDSHDHRLVRPHDPKMPAIVIPPISHVTGERPSDYHVAIWQLTKRSMRFAKWEQVDFRLWPALAVQFLHWPENSLPFGIVIRVDYPERPMAPQVLYFIRF